MGLLMSFGHLSALFWLIPLGAAIIVLYLLKMRRKDIRVPATFLWPQMTYEIRANSLFQKLRLSLLLFLQLLAILLIVLGLAQPQVKRKGLGGEVTVLVIDSSASMSATDIAPSRFEHAKQVATNIINQAKAGDRLCVIEAGPVPRVVFPLSVDLAGIRQALKSIRANDTESDVGEAMRLAVSLTAKQGSARIVLLSDGVFGEISNFSPGKARVDFERIGKDDANVAISSFGTSESPKGRLAFCNLKNYGKMPSLGTLTFKADGILFNSMKVEVPAKGSLGKTIGVPSGAKVIEALLANEDNLNSDNYAVSLADPGSTVRVLLMGQDDIFTERAFNLDPRVSLDKATELPSTRDYDIVVFDGAAEQKTDSRGVLTFGSAGSPSPVKSFGEVKEPSFLTLMKDHLLMQDVDFDGVYISRSEKVKAKADGEVIAEGRDGPWIVVSSMGQKRVYVSFQPLQSDFPLQPSFPIFISNVIDYIAPRESKSNTLAVSAGRPFSLPSSSEADRLTIACPDGTKETLKPFGSSFVVREARKVGRYDLTLGGKKQAVYASMINDVESNIEPVKRVLLGSTTVKSVEASLRLADFWRPALLLAFLVLGVEWFIFARRS